MINYHPLTIADVRPEGNEAVCVTLEVPDDLREAFRFAPGQHLGVRATIDGQEVRRTYSICSATDERHLRIGVRLHERGSMSGHLGRALRVGDKLEVLPPTGRFFLTPDAKAARTYCAFAGGSGITPILGIVRNVLAARARQPLPALLWQPHDRFDHVRRGPAGAEGSVSAAPRAVLPHEPRAAGRGVVQRTSRCAKVGVLGRELFDARGVDAYFLCGPDTMIDSVKEGLMRVGCGAVAHTQ